MSSPAITTPHLKFFDCCLPIALRTAYNLRPSISKPSCVSFSRNQTHFSAAISSSVSLKHRRKTVPFVAQTSDWAQEKDGSEYESDAADSPAWDGVEESDGGGEVSYPEPPEEAKLFVGNLPYDFDSEKLAQLFNQAGVVEISEVIYNRQTEQSRGFGFVTMSTVEEAEKAVEMFNRYDLNGRLLTVNKASPRGTDPPVRAPRNNNYEPSNRLYVGNLPWQVDEGRLEQVFSEHGKVVDAKVVYDRDTGRSRGFGFVTMSSEAESNDAIAALDGQSLDGRAIRVNVAEEKPRRSSSF